MLISLRKEGYTDISGIDISPEAIEYCSANSLNVELISDISSYVANSKSEYDFIIMSHVLEHLEKPDIIPTLRLIRMNLIREGGALIVMVPNAQSNTGCYWAYEDFTHHTLFTAGSLYFVLKSAGFESVKFLDPDGLEGSMLFIRWLKKFLLFFYKLNKNFWNIVTNSSFHRPSPQIFTYELKAIAK
jgi:2-polyprenyl-3-methyl-5-hydroxy-6-metoxy-1,4-benzoquinol methylase